MAGRCQSVRRKAFTLIELLVVVSIIALLIGILLPAIGETRRQARISLCTSNMKQHGQGASNYATQNRDFLPHAPASDALDAAEAAIYGPRGAVAYRFASDRKPINGFGFPGNGVKTFESPNHPTVVADSDRFKNLQGWNGYFIFLSEYMVDGEGAAALSDVFLSPSDADTKTFAWPTMRRYLRDTAQGAWWQLDQTDTISELNNPRCGSYRYVPAAMTATRIYSFDPDGRTLAPDYDLSQGEGPLMTTAQKQRYVVRNPFSLIDHGSQKALFFMWNAWHNSGKQLWCQPGVTTTIALADGGARAVRADKDGLPYIPFNDSNRAENAGPYTRIDDPANPGNQLPTHFWMTNGGLKGRDIN